MQKTLHRLFCLLLCAVMVLGMFPAAALAAEHEETAVATEHEGFMVTIGENGKRTYAPTTFKKEITAQKEVDGIPAMNAAKTKLGKATSLIWNKAEKQVYDEDSNSWSTKVQTFYGAIRFKPSSIVDESSDHTLYRITLYKGSKEVQNFTYGYMNDYLQQTEYVDEYLLYNYDFTSGTYYFTVQALAQNDQYENGPVVTSNKWTYTKPSSSYGRSTNLKWKGPQATWTPAVENYHNVNVEVYYASTASDEPHMLYWTWGEGMANWELDQWTLESYGTGYYYFKVRTLSDNIVKKYHSKWTSMSKAYNYTGKETPAKPTNLQIWDDPSGIPIVSWERSPGANQYEVYRATSKDGSYKKIATVGEEWQQQWYNYFDSSAKVGKTYYYKVRAISYTGIKSAFCSPVSGKCKLPAVSVTITNDASTGKPLLKWEEIEGAEKYEVYRATSKNGTYKKVKTTTSLKFKDTETKAGKVYYYIVKAIHKKSAYNSTAAYVFYTRCDLKRPVVSIQLTSGGNPYLKWKEISGAEKYFIYRATSKGGTYKRIGSTKTLKYVDKDVTAGKTYYYKVKAIHSNSGANSANSAIDYIKAK